MNVEQRFEGEGAAPMSEFEEEERRRDRRRRMIIIGVVVGALVIVAAYFMFAGGSGENAGAAAGEDGPARDLPTVTVIVPGSQSISNTITASGTLAARRPMPVGVAGEGGQIARVFVDAGDWVGAGQVLATIESSVQSQQVSGAAAQLEVARANLALAQANLDRSLQLVERGFISQADIDRLTATRDAERARVNVSAAQLNELRARAGRLAIRAPSAGLVLQRSAEPGQVVSAGSGALFMLAQGGEMEMIAQVSESDLRRMSVGQQATIVPVGTADRFEGQIWQLSPTIDPTSRQGQARVALSYEEGLRPGGFASAEIVSGSIDAPMLPESAVQSDNDGNYVYIINEDNIVERREVTIGTVSTTGITIREGLRGNERVVRSAGAFLNPGDEVIPQRMTQENES
ncbi:efflux RND transporter periplasmic adaptor subunit [Parasphingopyxis sp.]|uniref:efflux RND transporter periplasmic adaptor subunit n=1 Tax=Parasphingopyxis sp. TaxID=1920299 RepID=UPI0026364926|nr:efflux RND transporter periplasmic adaptor subunit [Parasphingopyxis sp.]